MLELTYKEKELIKRLKEIATRLISSVIALEILYFVNNN